MCSIDPSRTVIRKGTHAVQIRIPPVSQSHSRVHHKNTFEDIHIVFLATTWSPVPHAHGRIRHHPLVCTHTGPDHAQSQELPACSACAGHSAPLTVLLIAFVLLAVCWQRLSSAEDG